MVLLRPLTGRLGMRRKSEWLGGVDVTRGRGGSTGEHCTSMHCVGHHIQNEVVAMVLLRPLTGRLGMRRKRAGWVDLSGCTVWGTISRIEVVGWTTGTCAAGGVDRSTGEHCTSMHCVGHHIQN